MLLCSEGIRLTNGQQYHNEECSNHLKYMISIDVNCLFLLYIYIYIYIYIYLLIAKLIN